MPIRVAVVIGSCIILVCVLGFYLGRQVPSKRMAREIIERYWGRANVKMDEAKIVWADLCRKGEFKEFYAYYIITSGEDDVPAVDVFTVRNGKPENLLHRVAAGFSEGLEATHANLGGRNFFICSTCAGSGGFLDLDIYAYNGSGKLSLVHQEKNLFKGSFFIADGALCLYGGNQRFVLTYSGKKFVKRPYTKRLSVGDTPGTHVLRVEMNKDKPLFYFDNSPISFLKENEERYRSVSPLPLEMSGQILIDDSLPSPQEIRFLSGGPEFSFIRGFFYGLKPERTGSARVLVSHNYGDWYQIDFVVK
jgi:hypothetical protein